MRYVDFKNSGPPDVLFSNEGPIPEPGPNEVLIQVKAAGVCRPDLSQRAGTFPPPSGINPILGMEISGIVAKLGVDVTKWKLGDTVCGLTNGGGYAEYCAIPQTQTFPLPHALSFIEAASLPVSYFAVWGNLMMRARLKAGETVLIHGGAGGIGSCAIQLAKAFGAHVITTVSSPEKIAFCKDLQADCVINYQEEDFFSSLKNKGVDVIVDILGSGYFEKNLSILKEEGRLVQIACIYGPTATTHLDRLLLNRLTVLGSTLRAQSLEAKARICDELLQNVWPLFEKKALKPVVTAVFPIAEASEAHKLMESSQHCGKIVLEV